MDFGQTRWESRPVVMLGSLSSGLAGAVTLTALNEVARRFLPQAPRLEEVGMGALGRGLGALGLRPQRRRRLYGLALAGDLLVNTLYYGLAVGRQERPWRSAVFAGLGAAVVSTVVSPMLGGRRRVVRRSPKQVALTAAWYVAGGLAAAAVGRLFGRRV